MTIYIDLTQYIQNRLNTGIQRVVNEYLKRAIKDSFKLFVLYCTPENNFQLLNNTEVEKFLLDVKDYQFSSYTDIDIFNLQKENKFFFDIDSVWNSSYKRDILYKKLKQNNFKICNFIYDLIPILFPQFLHEKTKQTFTPFLKALYQYSDMVFFDSNSALNDFENIKKDFNITRDIDTKVVYLGSNFLSTTQEIQTKYNHLLSKKYILFVGTIEPRKEQYLALEAFEDIYKTNSNLHIIFIGKIGWNVNSFINKINNHPLKDKNIYHLQDINDITLALFYQNAFIVTYLSKYEGYGLPIVESLQYGNITITSNNSSIPEVGTNYVSYINNSSKTELIDNISLYLKDKTAYKIKKDYIKNFYILPSWDKFYNSITSFNFT